MALSNRIIIECTEACMGSASNIAQGVMKASNLVGLAFLCVYPSRTPVHSMHTLRTTLSTNCWCWLNAA
jgi:hypothetical protein